MPAVDQHNEDDSATWIPRELTLREVIEYRQRVLDGEVGPDAVVDKVGSRLLHNAWALCYQPMRRLLLERGADVNALDTWGETPLHRACFLIDVDTDVIRDLIAAGANMDAHGLEGRTPMHRAVTSHNAEVVALLLEAGADARRCNVWGHLPEKYAVDQATRAVFKRWRLRQELGWRIAADGCEAVNNPSL